MASLDEAESRMTSLESKILALEKGSTSADSDKLVDDAIKSYQSQVLIRLRSIRDTLISEGGDIASIREERDVAVQENLKLKKEIERLNYRVEHLIKSLNDEESRHS